MPLPINYPTALDAFANPSETTYADDSGYYLDEVITQIQDLIEILEARVGAAAASTDLLNSLRIHDGTNKSVWLPTTALSMFNPIPNSGFNVWQDGATFTSIADGTWGPDGWIYGKSGGGVHDLLRSTDVPTVVAGNQQANYSCHLDVTTADASIGASECYFIGTRIEGFNFLPLHQKQWTLRFWVKGSKTGVHYVAARNSGPTPDRSCVIPYTINVADTWEEKQITFPASPSAGTWNLTTGRGLELGWILAAGSNFHTTAGAWQTGNLLCASDQVNEMDSVSNNFRIALVGRPTLGTNGLLPFTPDAALEEYRCKRYNEVFGGSGANEGFGMFQWYGTTTALGIVNMVPKRATPSLGISASGDFDLLSSVGAAIAVTSGPTTILAGSPHKFFVAATASTATATAGQATALIAHNTSARLKLTARVP